MERQSGSPAHLILQLRGENIDDFSIGVDDVDGVEPAAQPDLQDDKVQRLMLQPPHDGQRRELEIGQRDVAARGLDIDVPVLVDNDVNILALGEQATATTASANDGSDRKSVV